MFNTMFGLLGRKELNATLGNHLNCLAQGRLFFQDKAKLFFAAIVTVNIGMVKGGNTGVKRCVYGIFPFGLCAFSPPPHPGHNARKPGAGQNIICFFHAERKQNNGNYKSGLKRLQYRHLL
jgi:hypothetical protein